MFVVPCVQRPSYPLWVPKPCLPLRIKKTIRISISIIALHRGLQSCSGESKGFILGSDAMIPGDGGGGPGSYGQGHHRAIPCTCHCDQVPAGFWCRPEPWLSCLYLIELVRGDQLFHQSAALSVIYRSNSSNLRLLSFEVPFYRRSQGLLVWRLSRPGTKAQARTLNIRSKKKKRGTQERGRIAEPDPRN